MPTWRRPQLFEIGRREAVYLPTPNTHHATDQDDCSSDWTKRKVIEPIRSLPLPSLDKTWVAVLGLGLCLIVR